MSSGPFSEPLHRPDARLQVEGEPGERGGDDWPGPGPDLGLAAPRPGCAPDTTENSSFSPRAAPPAVLATWSDLAGLRSHGEFCIPSLSHGRGAFSCGLKRKKKRNHLSSPFRCRSPPNAMAQ